jgi:preprotein translocase subunit SecG
MSFMFFLCVFLFVAIGVILSLLILVQESKSLGLGASFGGDSSSSLFGASTAEIVKKITAYLALIFLVGSLCITYGSHALSKAPKEQPVEIQSVEEK